MALLIIVLVLLLAACIVPLIIYGDPASFFKRDAVIWAAGGVALLVAILVNLMADKFPRRIDLTSEKKYSVSPELKHVLSTLDDEVKIIYYNYSTLQQFVPLRRDMIDKLSEVKNASNGKVELEIINVDPKDEQTTKELDSKGFAIQANSSGDSEVSISKLYSGVKITYKDKEAEYIPKIW